jgi:DNA-binding response OmpR family regulator
LVKQPDRPLTRLELIELGLGYDYEGLERTVDSHIKNLRQKLDQAGGGGLGTALVETVFGVGYRLRSQPDWVGESSE